MSAPILRTLRQPMAIRSALQVRQLSVSRSLGEAQQPPRTQWKPATAGTASDKALYWIVGAAAALGGTFFFLLSRPEKAIKASTDNLNTPSRNPSTDNRSPPAAGNKGQDA